NASAHDPVGRRVRRGPAEPERGASTPGCALEVRLQGREVDRKDSIRGEAAAVVVDDQLAGSVRLLLKRQSDRAPSTPQTGRRSPSAVAVQIDANADVQRLRPGGKPVQGDGSQEKLLNSQLPTPNLQPVLLGVGNWKLEVSPGQRQPGPSGNPRAY